MRHSRSPATRREKSSGQFAWRQHRSRFRASSSTCAGASFSGTVATFTDAGALPEPTDPGAAAAYSAKIRWGDGTTSAGAVTVRSTAPGFIVTGSHTYRVPAVRPMTVTILEHLAGKQRPVSVASVAPVNVARA